MCPPMQAPKAVLFKWQSHSAMSLRLTTFKWIASAPGKCISFHACQPSWWHPLLKVTRYISTPLTKQLENDPVYNDFILKGTPAGRWGTPEDLRGAAIFLASDASNFVTGSSLIVDGGMVAAWKTLYVLKLLGKVQLLVWGISRHVPSTVYRSRGHTRTLECELTYRSNAFSDKIILHEGHICLLVPRERRWSLSTSAEENSILM